MHAFERSSRVGQMMPRHLRPSNGTKSTSSSLTARVMRSIIIMIMLTTSAQPHANTYIHLILERYLCTSFALITRKHQSNSMSNALPKVLSIKDANAAVMHITHTASLVVVIKPHAKLPSALHQVIESSSRRPCCSLAVSCSHDLAPAYLLTR